MFILLKDSVLNHDVEVEFLGRSRRVTVKAVLWNDLTLCVMAAGKDTWVTFHRNRSGT